MPSHIDPDAKLCNCAACGCELVGLTSEHPVHGRKVVAGHRVVPLEGGGHHTEPLCKRCDALEKARKTRRPNVGGRTRE